MKKALKYIFVLFLMCNCSSGGIEDDEPVQEPPKKPVAATLVFPAQNSECTEGTNLTETNSTVVFKWNKSANTDTYELVLKNLVSGTTTTHTSSTNEKSIELLRATPYSWHIISKSNAVTDIATSTTWKFYNAGAGLVNYAPFPATAVAPTNGSSIAATASVTLEWNSSDVDNDVAHFDVYFGESGTLSLIGGDITANSMSNVSVASGKSYEWYVITVDAQGNTSTSETFNFSID